MTHLDAVLLYCLNKFIKYEHKSIDYIPPIIRKESAEFWSAKLTYYKPLKNMIVEAQDGCDLSMHFVKAVFQGELNSRMFSKRPREIDMELDSYINYL